MSFVYAPHRPDVGGPVLEVLLILMAILVAPCTEAQTGVQGAASVGPLWTGDDGSRLVIAFGVEQAGPRGLFGGADLSAFNRTIFPRGTPEGIAARQFVGSGLIGGRWLQQKPVAPFVSGGPSLVTNPDDCCGAGFGWTIGAGVDYWATRHLGVRLESRVVRPWGARGGFNLVRVGLVFRE